MTDDRQIAKLEHAAEQLRAAFAKAAEALEALEAVIYNRETAGQHAKTLLGAFVQAWQGRYRGARYIVSGARDMAGLKRLIVSGLEVEDVRGRLIRYVASNEPYLIDARHPLALFLANVNKYDAAPADDGGFLSSAPADCRHKPACPSDVAHTKRLALEARRKWPA